MWWWLQNEKCQDQFAIHYERGAMRDPCPLVAVYWIVPGGEPVIVNEHAEKQVNTLDSSFLKVCAKYDEAF